jgi:hypothetical protein
MRGMLKYGKLFFCELLGGLKAKGRVCALQAAVRHVKQAATVLSGKAWKFCKAENGQRANGSMQGIGDSEWLPQLFLVLRGSLPHFFMRIFPCLVFPS